MSRLEKTTCAAVAVFLVYLYLVNRDHTPTVSIDPASVGNAYDPFAEWRHHHPADYYRPFPLAVGPRCLPLIYQNQDSGLALEEVGPADGSYAQ